MLAQQPIQLTIETLILVAVWKPSLVFQGCFKITNRDNQNYGLLFYRCESDYLSESHLLEENFSPFHYDFTHLYQESGPIALEEEHALYALKYALHTCIKTMLTKQKLSLVSFDAVSMQAMIDTIRPLLNKATIICSEDEHIGFAVAMDFCPQDKTGRMAGASLLKLI